MSAVLASSVSIWAPLAYQYLVGGVLFVAGLVAAIRCGACRLDRSSDRFWFVVVIAGMVAYLAVHLIGYAAALLILPNTAGAG